MRAGNTFTIEPMINAGSSSNQLWPNNWTAVTVSLFALSPCYNNVYCTVGTAYVLVLEVEYVRWIGTDFSMHIFDWQINSVVLVRRKNVSAVWAHVVSDWRWMRYTNCPKNRTAVVYGPTWRALFLLTCMVQMTSYLTPIPSVHCFCFRWFFCFISYLWDQLVLTRFNINVCCMIIF